MDNKHVEIQREAPSICCKNITSDDCADKILEEILNKQKKASYSPVDFSRADDKFKKQVTEPINIFSNRKRLGELFGQEICDPNSKVYEFQDIFIYYEGLVQIDMRDRSGKTVIPCLIKDSQPKRKAERCFDGLIFNVFQGKNHFCSWVEKKRDNFGEGELIFIVEKDDKMYGHVS